MDQHAIRVLKAAPLLLAGAYTSYLLYGRAGEPVEAFGNHCQMPGPLYSWRFGVPAVDDFLCVVVQSFRQGLSTAEGTWITGYLITTLVSAYAFLAVEGSRQKAGWFLSLIPLHALLFMLVGISVVVPAIWLPSYILYNAGDRTPREIWRKKVSMVRIGAIALSLILLKLSAIAIFFPFSEKGKEISILLFQIAPIALACLWMLLSPASEGVSQMRGHRRVKAMHLLQAEAGLIWHLIGVLYIIRDPEIPWRVFKLLHSWSNTEFQAFFLLVDVSVLFLGFMYVIVLEDGTDIASLVALGSVLLGPASALSAYFAYREDKILQAVIVQERSKDF
uniref:Uncharacterized protein n=1 Tax=Physcomitrium patens TaxID=3218 RepID=A9T2C6_PHYPA|nr:uncharacterized protein LOC112282465 isoform X1 [Physcomitrium patens]XP_024375824.1 uncharacterized protein LOC112282465 isoform X1 [Physcomitrium patens]XP_024375825.1 uncharacterized protein LOC112282465 isoform X1 [Physcomitrium patens]PNR54481.1 hypothetical protein PHYPA_008158 [Physcomitrium patens]|eukprot:XP_024375823.1 uncharacterized protein LOC112282465 isoform X1 [Physcomitrella patens]